MPDRYLSDVISYQNDIAPYRFIQIYSGVGSGKNGWIRKLAQEGKRILLITSRQITADAQAKKLGADRWIDLDKLLDRSEWEFECLYSDITRCVVCTNFGFAKFVRNRFSPSDSQTYLWNKFDLIVLDECHSLSTDATFANDPFYIEKFIRFAIKQPSKCKFIFMTGTLSPIQWLLDDQAHRVHLVDYFQQCRHVTPERVDIVSGSFARRKILSMLSEGNDRVVYFVNTIKSMTSHIRYFTNHGISEDDIGVLYADNADDMHFSETLVKKKAAVIESLKTKECLPANVRILFTTSKGKEGININDKDIPAMYCESHYAADLVQMAGRVRNGLRTLYIIRDAAQTCDYLSNFTADINRNCVEAVNQTYQDYLNNYCNRNSTERAFSIEDRLIGSVEKMFSCICYSTISRRFEVYEGRIHGIQEYTRGVRDFSEYIKHWSDPVNQAGDCGSQLFKQWFPYSTIYLYGGSAPSDDEVAEIVENYLILHDYLNRQIQRGDAEAIRNFINRRLEPYGNRIAGMSLPIRNLGAALKHIGFQLARCGRNGSGQIIITRQETGESVVPDGIEIDL